MRMRLDRARVRVVATGIVLAAVAGCGGGDDDRQATDPGSGGETQSPSPTPSGLTGSWTPSPGQADKVQQALTAKGFECTRNADPAADLRVCSKSQLTGSANDLGGKQITQVNLRYLSDAQGTVVLAAIEKAGDSKPLVKTAAEALLPAADAAVYLADGERLTWGTVESGESDILMVKGSEAMQPYVPAFKPMATTKEKALPSLQAGKLTCKFSETDEWGTPQSGLTCSDPAFKVKNEDGSMEGGTAELVLVDDGTGINRIRIEGRHSRTPSENVRAVKQMVPKLLTIDGDQGLNDAGTWILGHLDGLPHSAYVGQWRVDLSVVIDGGIAGWPYVRAMLWSDRPNLGQKGAGTPSLPVTPDDTLSPGATQSPESPTG
jgi:hypothetical protein